MKIIHFVNRYHPSIGGSQHLFKCISEHLVTLFNDDVTVFTTNVLRALGNQQVELMPAGKEVVNSVKVRRFAFSRPGASILKLAFRGSRKLRLPFRDYAEFLYKGPIAPAMFQETMDFKADVMAVTPLGDLLAFYPYLAKRFGKKTPLVYWGALHILDNYIHPSILKAIKNVEAYVANTSYERDVLVSKGIPKNKIHVLGVGIHPESFSTANGQTIRDKFVLDNHPVVAFIGRQAIGKGIDTLLNAMQAVWKKIPSARLLIAGDRSTFSDQLHQMVGELSTPEKDRVIIVDGFSEDEKPNLFAACDVFVTASGIESFGIVYVEAWGCGKPVIGSRIGAVQSVISDGKDGLLVPYGNVGQLSEAILTLLKDEKLRIRLAENGRIKVETEYNWEVITKKLRKIYER
ncbi:MAG: glycosyltransferase family 4 protein, partial [Desulfosporosinus sp.]|nr:glycosyltransferase family 4 protein [Desulfosporosinus sp.]